jgi:ferric-dicitrate binding protein FerR (iron transport regulator)
MDELESKISVSLSRGSVFTRITGQLAGGFQIRTDTTVAGVRGTEFFIAFGRTIDSRPDVWLCVNSGSVEVYIPETKRTVVVAEGEGINILGGMQLTEPRFYPWTQELNWNTDPDRGEVRDSTDLDQAYSDLLDQDYD